MEMMISLGKALLKMTWWMVKLGLHVIASVNEEDKDRVPACSPIEAYEKLEREEISLDDFHHATNPATKS